MDNSLGKEIAEIMSDRGGLSVGFIFKLNGLVRGGAGALSRKGFEKGP
jgi:hypothetical protein